MLAGEDEAGNKEMLISAFKTGNVDYEVKADIPLSAANCEVRMLDSEHRLGLLDEVVFDGNTVKFSSFSNSACALVKIRK